MTRRRLHLVLALLLPLLALRALLPAGHMVAMDEGAPRIVLCSDGLAAWNTPDSDPAPHQQPDGANDCPFAHAALNAPPPHYVAGTAVATPDLQFIPDLSRALPPSVGPPRSGGARAPPATYL
jgi:hypothetical protein